MAVKQLPGVTAPDGSQYIVITDGDGNVISPPGLKQLPGAFAPDGSIYACPTNGTGTTTFGVNKLSGSFAPDGSVYVAFTSDAGNLQLMHGVSNIIDANLGVYIINGLPVTFNRTVFTGGAVIPLLVF